MAKLGNVVCGQAPVKATVDLGRVMKAGAAVIETLQKEEERIGLMPLEGAFALVLAALLLASPDEKTLPQEPEALGQYLEKALQGALLAVRVEEDVKQ